ncbi:hypothetical protein GUJ93_ZPchr0005g14483 [Zizania palustris]|uniref:Uncharacterized protein n=1 Tax=Zizania palustris TaxID=103762 RepID=A0A8J5SH34_ZIZPA|nr:hypothetical protein GUJ93_ZPchr0005g14483 [Zizania palustris]
MNSDEEGDEENNDDEESNISIPNEWQTEDFDGLSIGDGPTAAITAQVIDIDDDDDDSLHGEVGNMTVGLDSDGRGDIHDTSQHETKYVLRSGQKAVKVKGEISEHTSVRYYNDPQGDE